jgi:phosphoglycerate dehydrogenase-like enzyme
VRERLKNHPIKLLIVIQHSLELWNVPAWFPENLLITPHTASQTEQLWPRHYQVFSENLRRYLVHEPLLFVVDKQKAY